MQSQSLLVSNRSCGRKGCWQNERVLEAIVWLARWAAVISLSCRVHSARRRSAAISTVLDLHFADTVQLT